MKQMLVLSGILLIFSPLAGASASDGFFSAVYRSVENNTISLASERVAGVLKVEPELVERFVRTGKFTGDSGHLLDACRYEADKEVASGLPVPNLQQEECARDILAMWQQEYRIAQREITEFQKANAFARWWDGEVESEDDFDIYADLHLFDRQLNGSFAQSDETPASSKTVREVLSLAQNGYRMPADSPPFDARGDCGTDETSLYGGLVCIPQFCTDFMCVKIKAVPGRRGVVVPGQQKEASMRNLVTDLYEISKQLRDQNQNTPVRNVNAAHWWAQLFNFDQLLKNNIHFEQKTPPILAEFMNPQDRVEAVNYVYRYEDGGYSVQDRTNDPDQKKGEKSQENGEDQADESGSQSEADQEAEGENDAATDESQEGAGESEAGDEGESLAAELEARKRMIRAELQRVRQDEFQACEPGKQDCTSEDVLANFSRDCGFYLTRTYWGELHENALKCLAEIEANLPVGPSISDATNLQQVKQQFYKELPQNLDMLWEEMITLEQSMMSLNLCAMRQAKFRCGNKKIDCSVQSGL